MRKVIVNELMFIHAFERDEVFSDPCSQSAFLDLETGDVIWVFEEDDCAEMYAGIDPEDNAALGAKIAILNYFLTSHWLPLRHDVANAVQYVAGAVGEAMEGLPAGYTAEDQHGFDLRFEARNDIGVHAIPYDSCFFAAAAQPF